MRLSTSALPAEKSLGEWMRARRCDGRGCRFCFAIKSQKHNPRVAATRLEDRRAMDAEFNWEESAGSRSESRELLLIVCYRN